MSTIYNNTFMEPTTEDKVKFQIMENSHLMSKRNQKVWQNVLVVVNQEILDRSEHKGKYKQLSLNERHFIEICKECKISNRMIAKYLKRSPNTISKEVKRNLTKGYPTVKYKYKKAHEMAMARRKRTTQNNHKEYYDFKQFVIDNHKENCHWSFYQLIEEFKKQHKGCPHPSQRCLYDWLYDNPDILFLRHYRYKKQINKCSKTYYFGDKNTIDTRPFEMDDYVSIGHYEIDTVYNSDKKGGVLTLNHRATMMYYVVKIPDRKAKTIVKALRELVKRENLKIDTITSDNGSEFANWKIIEKDLGIKWFFARPYRSGDRGQNERLNRDLRIFYNKGVNFHLVDDNELQSKVNKINSMPRLKFNGMSAIEKERHLAC